MIDTSNNMMAAPSFERCSQSREKCITESQVFCDAIFLQFSACNCKHNSRDNCSNLRKLFPALSALIHLLDEN